jgi:hypothetical protein
MMGRSPGRRLSHLDRARSRSGIAQILFASNDYGETVCIYP